MINKAQKLFKIFADKNRLRIFKLLEHKKMCVCELVCILEVSQPSVSRHLKKMKDAGLIETEQDGFWTNYFLCSGSAFCENISSSVKWALKDDKVIKSDLKKLKTIDRSTLCRR